MTTGDTPDAKPDPLAFLAGGGEMGRLIRAFDWSSSPLGPVAGWPQSLRSALSICLNSNFPIALYWGDNLVLLYNDDWSPIPGDKHPWALGRPAREAWPEIWHIIEPLFRRVLATGEATRRRDQLLPMTRHGFTEECYFDYTFSPVRGEGGRVEGVFNAVIETTDRVVGERRLRTLRGLSAWEAGAVRTAENACRSAAHTLADNPHDLPFALLYLLGDDGRRATLAGLAGLDPYTPASPAAVDLDDLDAPWPFRRVAESGGAVAVEYPTDRFGPPPGGAWPEPTRRAVVLPLARPGQTQLAGFVVAGVSPRLALNDEYRGFLDLLAGHVGTAVANARAYEEERRRAEALAEIDRAKTAFFSNVSHEFRTPLTLMLGPVEDLLARGPAGLPPTAAEQLEVVNRNGQRLLRLVNSLLDFSRIEAGRVRAAYRPTDLAAYTADLASNFRSACERAGLRLVVDCPPLGEPAFVDREMWEKVVLNLLSNAFKFTFDGEIAVSVRQASGTAELVVRDTGTGIPADEMPRLFERFHRVENARGRTHEGSGIGLALVQELVKLHGGTITATSVVGEGTAFTASIPLGSAHLPPDQVAGVREVAPTGGGALPYVEEALRWLPDAGTDGVPTPSPSREPIPAPTAGDGGDDRPRVLVADDNTDMRQYVTRLLAGAYRVEAVADGQAGLEAAAERPPDLILTDVMMPRLDGFGLLRGLRADPRTRDVPVILLSARAGEESRVEGMEAGADDYLVKPFSARELLARVSAHLQMTRMRRAANDSLRESELRYRLIGQAANDAIWDWDLLTSRVAWNEGVQKVFGYAAVQVGADADWWVGHIHPDDRGRVGSGIHGVIDGGGEQWQAEYRFRRADGTHADVFDRGRVVRDRAGKAVRMVGSMLDLSERKRAEQLSQFAAGVSAALADLTDSASTFQKVAVLSVPTFADWCAVDMVDEDGQPRRVAVNHADPDKVREFAALLAKYPPRPGDPHGILKVVRTGESELVEEITDALLASVTHDEHHFRRLKALGLRSHILAPIRSHGRALGVVTFITAESGRLYTAADLVVAEDLASRAAVAVENARLYQALQEADRRKDEFLATLAHELRNPLAPIRNAVQVFRLKGAADPDLERGRDVIDRQVDHLTRLIDDLLDISRIARNKLELRKGKVTLADAVAGAVETSRPLIEQMGHDLAVELPPQPVYLDADLVRLSQVFMNLLTNAAKYTPEGGRIRLTARRDGGDVVVAVADTGLGIPAEKLPNLFEMFFQVDGTLEKAQGGLGIGLSLVRRLVEMHGGTVAATSPGVNRGSEFTVRLPVLDWQPDPPAPESSGDGPAGVPLARRILVVDDNRDAADTLAMLLEMTGHEVRTAHDGEAGVAAAGEFRPDVILMDIGMPKLNGYDAARRIRGQSWGERIMLVALTGWGQDDDRRRTVDAGFDAHLVKPVDHAALTKLLEQTGRTRPDYPPPGPSGSTTAPNQ